MKKKIAVAGTGVGNIIGTTKKSLLSWRNIKQRGEGKNEAENIVNSDVWPAWVRKPTGRRRGSRCNGAGYTHGSAGA